jgi:putative protease
VRWEQTPKGMETRLNGVLIDRYADHEKAGYPTLCKGRFEVQGETYYALEEPTSLNSMDMLPEMARLGIAAIKIEGRQRSPAYVAEVTKVWRAAIDAVKKDRATFKPLPAWQTALAKVSEGSMNTLGAYYRPWK